jgi:hypothetical protein
MEYLNISKVCTTAILKELRDNYGFKTEWRDKKSARLHR